MKFHILPLEERIVLDAAAVGQAIVDLVDHTDYSTNDSSDTDYLEEGSLFSPPSAENEAPLRVLVVSSRVMDAEQFAEAASDDVLVVSYDAEKTTLEELSAKITLALEGRQADSIAFATHGQRGMFHLTDDVYVSKNSLDSNRSLQRFWMDVADQLQDGGRVDLLGCNLAGDVDLLDSLDGLLDVDGKTVGLAASLDLTGNFAGANWVLESGGVDASLYFEKDELREWTGTLAAIVVDTAADVADGDTSSITNLQGDKGADGRISLREAITAANNTAGMDTVTFAIPTGESHTIRLQSDLPGLTESMVLDGGTDGDVPRIEVIPDPNGTATRGFYLIGTGQHVLRGFVIGGFQDSGVTIVSNENVIEGNLIGLAASGTEKNPNRRGLELSGGESNIIGGVTDASRNVISGNDENEIRMWFSQNTVIMGNYIGTDISGKTVIADRNNTLVVSEHGTNDYIGADAPSSDVNRVVKGNVFGSSNGIALAVSGNQSADNEIVGNYFGVSEDEQILKTKSGENAKMIEALGVSRGATGTLLEGNVLGGYNLFGWSRGVSFSTDDSSTVQDSIVIGNYFGVNRLQTRTLVDGPADRTLRVGELVGSGFVDGFRIGGVLPGEGNVIADGFQSAILGNDMHSILGNTIYGQTGIAIDNPSGPTAATLTSATQSLDQITVQGSMNEDAGTNYRVEYFLDDVGNSTGAGGARFFLGAQEPVAGNATLNATFDVPDALKMSGSYFVTATVTEIDPAVVDVNDQTRYINTSNFSTNLTMTVTVDPSPTGTADLIEVNEGGTATLLVGGGSSLLDNDLKVTPTDTLSVLSHTDPKHGTLTINANGTFSYTHDGTENYFDEFSYVVQDNTGQTNTGVVTISVNPVNDNTPFAYTDFLTVHQGNVGFLLDTGLGSLLSNDFDLDHQADYLAITGNSAPTHGTLTLTEGGFFEYVHDGSANFTDSFTYTIEDTAGQSATGLVTIQVIPSSATTINNTYTVTTAEDTVDAGDGKLSLREAIIAANGSVGLDEILFDIPTNETHTIRLVSQLPSITDALILDGGSDLDRPRIVLDGSQSRVLNGLILSTANSSGSTIKDFVIQGFQERGILVEFHSHDNTIQGNYIGLLSSGLEGSTTRIANGIAVDGSGNLIGGVTEAERNVISSNAVGIYIGPDAIQNVIMGNYLGTDANGNYSKENTDWDLFIRGRNNFIGTDRPHESPNGVVSGNVFSRGIWVRGVEADQNEIIGNYFGVTQDEQQLRTSKGAFHFSVQNQLVMQDGSDETFISDNVFGGYKRHGWSSAINSLDGSYGSVVVGNYFGTDRSGTRDLLLGGVDSNQSAITNGGNQSIRIGGMEEGEGNIFRGSPGSSIISGGDVVILGNSISESGSRALDLDSGLDVPALTSATQNMGNIDITGTVGNDPNASYRVEFFLNEVSDFFGGEGRYYLGSHETSGGTTPFALSFAVPGQIKTDGTYYVSSTVTEIDLSVISLDESLRYVKTSEFSANQSVVLDVAPAPTANSDSVVIQEGDLFTSPFSVLDSDSPVNGADTLTAELLIGPKHGVLNLATNGTFDYQHDGSESRQDRFVYRVTDQNGRFDTAEVSIQINPVNDHNPVAYDDFLTVKQGASGFLLDNFEFSLLANDFDGDFDGDTLSITGHTNPTYGTLTLSSEGVFEYIHDGTANYTDSFTYTVEDENSNVSTGTVFITILPDVFAGNTITVTTASDVVDGNTASISDLVSSQGADGRISLREAIIAANNTAGLDMVVFDIPTGESHTIQVTNHMQTIEDALIIDGSTDPDVDRIEITGSINPNQFDGLTVRYSGSGTTIRGLVLNDFAWAIELGNSNNNKIVGNYIGLDTTGTVAVQNNGGIYLDGSGNVIGGADLSERNVISGSIVQEIRIESGGTHNVVLGNLIGTDATGTIALKTSGINMAIRGAENIVGADRPDFVPGQVLAGNVFSGSPNDNTLAVESLSALENEIIGNYFGVTENEDLLETPTGSMFVAQTHIFFYQEPKDNQILNNVFGGYDFTGIEISHSPDDLESRTIIQGNYIGIDRTGTKNLSPVVGSNPLSNRGIQSYLGAYSILGGTEPGQGNVIANQSVHGIEINRDNVVLGNTIYNVGSLPINRVATPKPVVTGFSKLGDQVEITGNHNAGNPGKEYRIEFFLDEDGQARYYIGAIESVMGEDTFTANLTLDPGFNLTGDYDVTATATEIDSTVSDPNDLTRYVSTSGLSTQFFSFTLSNPPEIVSAVLTNSSPGELEETQLVVEFADADTADSHTVTIDWGDGATQTLNFPAGVYNFTDAHDYADAGNYTITLTVEDDGIEPDIFTIPVTVINQPPVADAGGPYTIVVNDANLTLDGSASYDPGEKALTFNWDLDNDGQFDDATGEFPLFPSSMTTATNTYTIKLQVSDPGGEVGTDTTTVTVIVNTDPIANDDGPYTVNESGVLTVSALDSNHLLNNDSDPESYPLSVIELGSTGALTGLSTKGATVTLQSDGSFTYNPTLATTLRDSISLGDVTTDTFTYRISDGELTDTATVTVTVNGVADLLYSMSIDGTVFFDDETDGDVSGDDGIENATVYLYKDINQNGLPDDLGGVIATTTTGAGGTFHFDVDVNSEADRFWVAVDASSLDGTRLLEQTYGADGALSGNSIVSAGALFGGRNSAVADDATDLSTSEHLIAVDADELGRTGVDFGFSPDVVTNTNDAGQGSFRAFIQNANANSDLSVAVFVLEGGSTHQIDLASDLNAIVHSTEIDASSVLDELIIDGGGLYTGLHIQASDVLIQGLTLQNHSEAGIQISGVTDNVQILENRITGNQRGVVVGENGESGINHTNTKIVGNSIYNNVGLGIDRLDDGIASGDPAIPVIHSVLSNELNGEFSLTFSHPDLQSASGVIIGSDHVSEFNASPISIKMTDSYGDGWNGGAYRITNTTTSQIWTGDINNAEFDVQTGGIGGGIIAGTDILDLPSGTYTFEINPDGSWPSEIGWTIEGALESPISGGSSGIFNFTVGGFNLEIYKNAAEDDSGYGEGQTLLWRGNVGESGTILFNESQFLESYEVGDIITLLYTTSTGQTSEFSLGFEENISASITNANVIVNEGTIATNSGTFGDVDGDVVTITSSIGSVVTDQNNGTWIWTGDSTNSDDGPGDSQTVILTFDDSNGHVINLDFELEVLNLPPNGVDDSGYTLDQNSTIQITDLLDNDSDPSPVDDASLQIIEILTDSLTGELTIHNLGTGDVTYDPNGAYDALTSTQTATTTFQYVVQDKDGDASTVNVTINVTGVDDPPELLAEIDDIVVNEDADDFVIPLGGTFYDPDQIGLTIEVTNSNGQLLNADLSEMNYSMNTTLTLDFLEDQNGTATITVTVTNPREESVSETFLVTVLSVNDAPTFDLSGNLTIPEDSPAQSASNFLSNLSLGPDNESDQQLLTYSVTTDRPDLFAVQPEIDIQTGTLTYTPAPNGFGMATITVQVTDDGGVLNEGDDTGTETFTITMEPSDDPLTKIGEIDDFTVDEDAPQTVIDLNTIFNDPDTIASLDVTITNSHPDIVDAALVGDHLVLTYLADQNSGPALIPVDITVSVAETSGNLDSAEESFSVVVTPVNDLPSYTIGPDLSVVTGVDPKSFTYAFWATDVFVGPSNENQYPTFTIVSNDNTALFDVVPTVSEIGALSFTLAAGATGTATIGITLSDGVDTTSTETFTITATEEPEPADLIISGYVRLDNDVDADPLDTNMTDTAIEGAVVRIYRDDGDGIPEIGVFDIPLDGMTQITDANGFYSFTLLAEEIGNKFWITVDSSGLDSTRIVDQTYGPNGEDFGGRSGNEDNAAFLVTSEHLSLLEHVGTNIENQNFGFSYEVITNTNSSGQGSLRQFILNNANSPSETLYSHFHIPGEGPHVISLPAGEQLPTITKTIYLDALTQGGDGYEGPPLVMLDGGRQGSSANHNGIFIQGDNATGSLIQGFVIDGFGDYGIFIDNTDAIEIYSNYIGTNVTGEERGFINTYGIRLYYSEDTIVGGAGKGNIISSQSLNFYSYYSPGSVIQGNWIGTNPNGSTELGSNSYAMYLYGGSGNEGFNLQVGGINPGEGNVIGNSGSSAYAVYIYGFQRSVFQGNYIGITPNGDPIPNNGRGIYSAGATYGSLFGGSEEGAGNVITNNALEGIETTSSTTFNDTAFLGNSIYGNGNLGIDLGANGVTGNDPLDADNGSNGYQNYPDLLTLESTMNPSLNLLTGTLHSEADTYYRIEFFGNDEQDPSGFGEGKRFLDAILVKTDSFGDAHMVVIDENQNEIIDPNAGFTIELPSGERRITSTATKLVLESEVDLNDVISDRVFDRFVPRSTSEFSGNVLLNTLPELSGLTDPITVNEGTLGVTRAGTFSDPDAGETVTLSANIGNVVQTTGNGNGGDWVWTYDALDGDSISETVIITATDSLGESTELNFTLTVLNLPPTANPDSGEGYITSPFQSFIIKDVRLNDTDPNLDPNTELQIGSVDSVGTNGGLITLSGNTITYDPNGQFDSITEDATDTFTYILLDEDGEPAAAPGTVTITIKPVISTVTISGSILEDDDVDGAVNSLTDNGFEGVEVFLYKDNGDGVPLFPEDNFIASTLTMADGSYSFLVDVIDLNDQYWVLVGVDSFSAGLPDQTYGSIGSITSDATKDLNADGLTDASGGLFGGADPNKESSEYIDGYLPGNFTVNLVDTFGDGWNGGSYEIYSIEDNTIVQSGTLQNGSSGQDVFLMDPGEYGFRHLMGSFAYEMNFELLDSFGTVIFSGVGSGSSGGVIDYGAFEVSTEIFSYPTELENAEHVTLVSVNNGDQTNIDFGFSYEIIVNTNSSGQGSLDQMIRNNNLRQGPDPFTSEFRIPGEGPHVISSPNGFETITKTILLDGFTQGGDGYDGPPLIMIDGEATGSVSEYDGFYLQGDDAHSSLIQGFVINGFGRYGIHIDNVNGPQGTHAVEIYNNYIGTDITGEERGFIYSIGIRNYFSDGAIIGGIDKGNIISSNLYHIYNYNSPDTIIQGNWIGTNPDGSTDLGTNGSYYALYLYGGTFRENNNLQIGGVNPGEGNVIGNSSSTQGAFSLFGVENSRFQGNYIGVTPEGKPIPNNGSAFYVGNYVLNNLIGGVETGAGNVIAYNGDDGLEFIASFATAIIGNSIYGNGELGIDLGNNGPTGNDGAGDSDTGPNDYQNYPLISSVVESSPGLFTITATLETEADSFYRVEFFQSSAGDPSGYGEGEQLIGFVNILTDSNGLAANYAEGLVAGDPLVNNEFQLENVVLNRSYITAVATKYEEAGTEELTDYVDDGTNINFLNSSEFSPWVAAYPPGTFLGLDLPSITVNEGELATSEGFTDAISDPFIVGATAGEVELDPNFPGFFTYIADTSDGDGVAQTVTVYSRTEDGSYASNTIEVTVNNVLPTLSLIDPTTLGDLYEGNRIDIQDLGLFMDPAFSPTETFEFLIDWGDGTPFQHGTSIGGEITIDAWGAIGTPTQGSFNASHTYGDNGEYTVTVYLTDDDGSLDGIGEEISPEVPEGGEEVIPIPEPTASYVMQSMTLTILNQDPQLLYQLPEQPAFVGTPFELPATDLFFDAAFAPSETFSYVIDWGDFTTSTGSITNVTYGSPGILTEGTLPTVSHVWQDEGTFTVSVTILDDDGGVSNTATFDVSVISPIPEITELTPSPATPDEGTPGFALTATFETSGNRTSDTFDYQIDWGDNTTSTGNVTVTYGTPGQGIGVLSFDHLYVDDGLYDVLLTIFDDYGGSENATVQVSVNNVAPTGDLSGNATVDEGTPYTLTVGPATDPGDDTVTSYIIQWGDGQTDTVTATGDYTHTYVNGPTTNTISLTLVDEDGTHVGAATMDVQVQNVAPTVDLVTTVVEENGTATVQGTFTDPAFDYETYTVTGQWADGQTATFVVNHADGTFTTTRTFLDDDPSGTPLDSLVLNVTVEDSDGGVTNASVDQEIQNVAPVVTSVSSSSPYTNIHAVGDEVSVTANFTDVGTLDTHTATVDWGDGTVEENVTITNGIVSSTHVYGQGGAFQVEVTITDDDTLSGSATTEVVIEGGVFLSDGVLGIVGDYGDNIIIVRNGGDGVLEIRTSFTPGYLTEFNMEEIESLHIFTVGGEMNHVKVSKHVLIDTVIQGSSGQDRVRGGGGDDLIYGAGDADRLLGMLGNDFIMGGDGNDLIKGGRGHDVLFGGDGKDLVKGGTGDDLIVGGVTNVDVNPLFYEGLWQTLKGSTVNNPLYQESGNSGNNPLFESENSQPENPLHEAGTGTANNPLFGEGAPPTHNPLYEESAQAQLNALFSVMEDDEDHDILIGNQGVDWFWGNFEGAHAETDHIRNKLKEWERKDQI